MRTAPEAIRIVNAQRTNSPGMCQRNTWMAYGAHSVGDVDRDGDADAVDGWKSEPAKARHTGRKPMIGAPCAWGGGSGGFGHRAICVGYNSAGEALIRSTDAGGRGVMATKPLSWFERNWHLVWLGWSETISGEPIVGLRRAPGTTPQRPSKPKHTRGKAMDESLALAKKVRAKKGSARDHKVKAYIKAGEAVPFIK